MVNLSVCLINILFVSNFCKNSTMSRRFWYVFELDRFALLMKNCYFIVHRSFYRALQKFQYINIFCSFSMNEIDTNFWYVFKLHTSDFQTKISHRIQYILFYRALQEFEYIYHSFLMTQIAAKIRNVFILPRSDQN